MEYSQNVKAVRISRQDADVLYTEGPRNRRVLAIGNDFWHVHRSYAGVLSLLLEALGPDAIEIDQEKAQVRLHVPKNLEGQWVGKEGCIRNFFQWAFGGVSVWIVGDR